MSDVGCGSTIVNSVPVVVVIVIVVAPSGIVDVVMGVRIEFVGVKVEC